MGCRPNIAADRFPKQGSYLNARVNVCFHYDTSKTVMGTVIRDDAEEPGIAIINLDDGRTLLTTECQWSPVKQ